MNGEPFPDLHDLQPWDHNPRKMPPGHMPALQRSMSEHGDISGITFNRTTKRLVCGHQRVLGLRQQHGDALRMVDGAIVTPTGERFPVRVVDWDEAKERTANVAANSPLLRGSGPKPWDRSWT
jgi:hypothetical protein